MRYAGIDIGSRTIEIVVLENLQEFSFKKSETTHDPLAQAKRLLANVSFDCLMATGYGRHLLAKELDIPTVTEISAYATGVQALFSSARTILDIGGQDTKVIAVNGEGRILRFEMNDRCAAGTGRFLEVMAGVLGVSVSDFGSLALEGQPILRISSTCTVFAESEAVSLLAKGERREDIALALHGSVVRRSVTMLKRVSLGKDIVFAGGVALNPCLRVILEKELGQKIIVPDNPQMIGAYGAALYCRSAAHK